LVCDVGNGPRALTSGAFEVDDVRTTPDGATFFFVANATDHGVHEVWSLPVNGGELVRRTAFDGRVAAYDLARDGRTLLASVSRALEPTEVYEVPLDGVGTPRRLTNTIEPAWAARGWCEPEYVLVPGRAGGVPARLYRPAGAATAKRPAVLFVHGAGYLQNAHRGFSTYQREFMFHTFLVQQGFVVLDMDYRASAGYGRDWRTAIHRNMGGPELEDLVDGAQWLARELDVDPERIGLYGGSYGGFMTLMALFKAPDVFACGAALRPVTDWSHYNDSYTSAILHTPELDEEAYLRSSPIEFAEGLADPLLVCHGLVDDNVLAKDSIRLSQRLVELGKQDFEVMLYPAEAHAFRWPSSWLDEYRRIWKLFEEHLLEPRG
jgi:dipeptidyl aminopeptidase/acylaminoacyl peptidase